MWAYLVIATTAAWLVPLLLGHQWDQSVPTVRLLAIGRTGLGSGVAQAAGFDKTLSKQIFDLCIHAPQIVIGPFTNGR